MSESLITKKAIATALKSLILEKPFDKISIADLTKACGLNRQTFYYHFQDKYELLTWIYYTEGFAFVVEDITFENWDQKIKDIKEYHIEYYEEGSDVLLSYHQAGQPLFYGLSFRNYCHPLYRSY